ncbi:MAG: type II secretion system GspH family protein [Planctomycetes bacterium]|jgi:type II secretory pathway pseudopilin PulG|nr:type II secretion system GspH family protein [Planctomycetota bacterium]
MKNQKSKIKNHTFVRGFTLIEVLIATAFVGLSIAALVAANGSFSMANATGADLSTAEFLVEQIRELTALLPLVEPGLTTWTSLGPGPGETLATYDDVDDFDGFDSASRGGPISAQRTTLTQLKAFRQRVTVQKLNPTNFNQVWSDSSASNFARVTVTVLENGRQISTASWIRARY